MFRDTQKLTSIKEQNERLFTAAERGDKPLARKALKAGADIEATWKDGRTPLMIAAYSRHKHLVEYFIKKGANVDAKEGYLLAFGSRNGYLWLVELLLKNGANANIKNRHFSDGCTPLALACDFGKNDVVKLLLEYRADVTIKDFRGFTPLDLAKKGLNWAKQREDSDWSRIEAYSSIVQLLSSYPSLAAKPASSFYEVIIQWLDWFISHWKNWFSSSESKQTQPSQPAVSDSEDSNLKQTVLENENNQDRKSPKVVFQLPDKVEDIFLFDEKCIASFQDKCLKKLTVREENQSNNLSAFQILDRANRVQKNHYHCKNEVRFFKKNEASKHPKHAKRHHNTNVPQVTIGKYK